MTSSSPAQLPVWAAITIAVITGISGFAAGGYTTTFEYFTGKLVKSELMDEQTKRAEKTESLLTSAKATLSAKETDLAKALADLKESRSKLVEAQDVIATNNRGAQKHPIAAGGSYTFPGTDLTIGVTKFSAADASWSATLTSGGKDYSVANYQPLTTIVTKNNLNCDVSIVDVKGSILNTSAECRSAH